MKYSTQNIKNGIDFFANGVGDITIMEVCGTHTASIRKFALASILPNNIKMVSGPGCPVCVTSQEDISASIQIADREDVIFTCFGDMMRVPSSEGSLYSLYEKGRDIRIVTSPMDALKIAKDNLSKHVVYFGIGFETTAPHTAALIEAADNTSLTNISVLNAHKTMPSAIKNLLMDGSKINALLCPGHVASIIGADAFSFVSKELQLPAVIAGFEGYEILVAILKILELIKSNKFECVNMYPKAVSKKGNKNAVELLYKVMEPYDAIWRGLDKIPNSGLKIRDMYKQFDALERFDVVKQKNEKSNGCMCAKILRGENIPPECNLYGKSCVPDNPFGPCMVSSEGCCSVYYRYKEQ